MAGEQAGRHSLRTGRPVTCSLAHHGRRGRRGGGGGGVSTVEPSTGRN